MWVYLHQDAVSPTQIENRSLSLRQDAQEGSPFLIPEGIEYRLSRLEQVLVRRPAPLSLNAVHMLCYAFQKTPGGLWASLSAIGDPDQTSSAVDKDTIPVATHSMPSLVTTQEDASEHAGYLKGQSGRIEQEFRHVANRHAV